MNPDFDFAAMLGDYDNRRREFEQTHKLYYAQYLTFNDPTRKEDMSRIAPTFFDRAAIERYAESVRKSEFVLSHWPKAASAPEPKYGYGIPRRIVDQFRRRDPNDDGGEAVTNVVTREIYIAERAASPHTILHELAHLILVDNSDSSISGIGNDAAHNALFAGIMLALVDQFMSHADALKLKGNFDALGVEYDHLT